MFCSSGGFLLNSFKEEILFLNRFYIYSSYLHPLHHFYVYFLRIHYLPQNLRRLFTATPQVCEQELHGPQSVHLPCTVQLVTLIVDPKKRYENDLINLPKIYTLSFISIGIPLHEVPPFFGVGLLQCLILHRQLSMLLDSCR